MRRAWRSRVSAASTREGCCRAQQVEEIDRAKTTSFGDLSVVIELVLAEIDLCSHRPALAHTSVGALSVSLRIYISIARYRRYHSYRMIPYGRKTSVQSNIGS